MSEPYTYYEHVPWYRRSAVLNVLIVAGFFVFPPLLWFACLSCLTGDIYKNEMDEEGALTKCPASLKVAALAVFLAQSCMIAYAIWSSL